MSSMVVDRGRQLEAKFIGSGRCLPAARGRAGSEGHVWPWNPTSPRRRAFHSSVSSPPSPLLRPSLSLRLPTPRLRVPLLLSRCLLPSPRPLASHQLALTLRPTDPVSSNSLSSLEPRLLFENFTVYVANLQNPPEGKFPEISFDN